MLPKAAEGMLCSRFLTKGTNCLILGVKQNSTLHSVIINKWYRKQLPCLMSGVKKKKEKKKTCFDMSVCHVLFYTGVDRIQLLINIEAAVAYMENTAGGDMVFLPRKSIKVCMFRVTFIKVSVYLGAGWLQWWRCELSERGL